MPLFYYDRNGYKIGPIDKKTLITLAEKGTINPDTRLTDGNKETAAKNVPELKFAPPKVYAPEYYHAAEVFDFENNTIPTTTPPITKQETEPPAKRLLQKSIHKKENKSIPPLPSKSGYFYLTARQRTLYFLANVVWYCGFAVTIIATLILIVNPVIMFLVFIAGTLLTMAISTSFGITADIIQWLFNIEEHLEQMKSRSEQND